MAEWSIAAVLKTVDLRGSGGSNPSFSAKVKTHRLSDGFFVCANSPKTSFLKRICTNKKPANKVRVGFNFDSQPLWDHKFCSQNL